MAETSQTLDLCCVPPGHCRISKWGCLICRLRPDCVDTHRQTSAELSNEGGKEAGHCAEGLLRRHPKRELAVGQSMELRYLCGWYSIVAPVVGLAMPFKLWTSKAEAGNDVQ